MSMAVLPLPRGGSGQFATAMDIYDEEKLEIVFIFYVCIYHRLNGFFRYFLRSNRNHQYVLRIF
jgi:hypothetical protein